MTQLAPLPSEALYTTCNPDELSLDITPETTEQKDDIIGQDRALDAINFGMRMNGEGYNVFALGTTGTGKFTAVHQILAAEALTKPTPPDWCYVYNFETPHKPNALKLPPGRGAKLRADMEQLIDDLGSAIPAAFETEDYHSQVEKLEQEFNERRQKALEEIDTQAKEQRVQFIHTPAGFAFAPLDEHDEVIRPEQYQKLEAEEKTRIENQVAELQQRLQRIIRQFPVWQKEARQKTKELDRQIARLSAGHLISVIKEQHSDLPEVVTYLDAVEQDIVENVREFRTDQEAPPLFAGMVTKGSALERYKVNVIVDHSEHHSAPVVHQDSPTHANLVGRTEYRSQMGTLVTDFTLIKAGDLHRANGGYLILDARRLLLQPYAWESLKRALRSTEILIEPLERTIGLISTISLEPEPIHLDIKVVLVGDRFLYYLLYHYDPEFRNLFRVSADFEETIDRSPDSASDFARLIANMAKQESLLPLDRAAIARVIEHSARLADDAEKLSIHLQSTSNLLREADYWARESEHNRIMREDVQCAIDKQIYRSDRVRKHVYEAIKRRIINIDVSGKRTGQINGLSVIDLGDFSFGQPSRITATTRLGEGKVVDIERETKLGGNIHSKGVLILSSFLASRYAKEHPLSLSASLVFEQSYGLVEGDSASVAELCALLSTLAELPIQQCFAVTGSVNQLGQVQAIGGVNQKIEGFFDVCTAHGDKQTHGVLIPASNVKHLMLRDDIVKAASDDKFQVFPVENVDQAMELLTGVIAGERDEKGNFPPESINGRVESKLIELATLRREYAKESDSDDSE